jgi:thiol-disulfide isomerase/thioredoxin
MKINPLFSMLITASLLATACNQMGTPSSEEQNTAPSMATPAASREGDAPKPSTTTGSSAASSTTAMAPAAESGGFLRASLTMRDGTTGLTEFAEPHFFRFESTEVTVTCDGDLCLAVFPDMRSYAVFDAPKTISFESLADLSPILEPIMSPHFGLVIPTTNAGNPPGWKPVDDAMDPARFSTAPPKFHRDITSQVARPVGDYAARRLEGSPAPFFEVTDLDGRKVTLDDFEGKPVVIDFWATWCPPCLESMPRLDALDQRYGASGLVVLGMNMDDGSSAARDARQFVSSRGLGFRQALGGSAAADFRVEVLPTMFLLDREHIIRAVYIGVPPDDQTLRGEVEMLIR